MSYTRGTFAALVDAVVPETPDLASAGEEQVPGGLAVGLEEALVERVNGFQEVDGGLLDALGYDRTPLAPVVAVLLDVAAVELVVRGRADDGLRSPDEPFARGPFCRLTRRDRLRALRLLEDDGVFPGLTDRLDSAGLGTVQFIAGSIVILTEYLYYSDVTGDSETAQGWRQAGYPGPADGYRVLLGYEVDAFEENDY